MKSKPKVWSDENPFFLLIVNEGVANIIDLGKRGWAKTYKTLMRKPGRWHLVHKASDRILAVMDVYPGEQPYYVARHVGIVGTGGGVGKETTSYGIGKKRLDGHVDRIWFLANGSVTLGDDLEAIAIDLLKAGQI